MTLQPVEHNRCLRRKASSWSDELTTTFDFRKRLRALPPAVRKKAVQTYKLWKDNPSHPSLHFKRVNESRPIYSVRIALQWRALGLLKDDTVTWFWIGNHKDYDRIIG